MLSAKGKLKFQDPLLANRIRTMDMLSFFFFRMIKTQSVCMDRIEVSVVEAEMKESSGNETKWLDLLMCSVPNCVIQF